MIDIDLALERLSNEPAPPQLAALEERVLRQVAGHSFHRSGESYGTRIILVGLALMIGIVGGLAPGASADAQPSLARLTGAEALAPSALLTGTR